MANISQQFTKGLIKDGYTYMFEKYDAIPEVWPMLYTEQDIDGDFWKSTSVVNSGSWRRTTESEGFTPQNIAEGFTVYGRIFDYTQAVVMSNNLIKDHQKVSNFIKVTAAGWGVSAKETREEFFSLPFNNGGLTAGHYVFNGTPESKADTDPSGDLAYDSAPFFNLSNNTRSSKGGGTYYNGAALSLGTDNVKTQYNLMTSTNNRRENDTICKITPEFCLYPPALTFTAREIFESTLVPFGSTNTKNTLQAIVKGIEWHYLTDTNAWFMGSRTEQSMVALKRQAPVIDIFQDKRNRVWWAVAEMRMGLIMKNWRYWVGSNFSTS